MFNLFLKILIYFLKLISFQVINYDLPNNRELYIHRIGRSGRFGRKVGNFYYLLSDQFQD